MSTIKTTTLSNVAGTSSVPVDTVINGSAKAWVNFNGTGTVAIQASFNVSSITDNGTGNYTVNFTNALADANYVAFLGNGGGYNDLNGTHTSTALQVYTYNFANPPVAADRTPIQVAAIR
jgi:hypothetical protein